MRLDGYVPIGAPKAGKELRAEHKQLRADVRRALETDHTLPPSEQLPLATLKHAMVTLDGVSHEKDTPSARVAGQRTAAKRLLRETDHLDDPRAQMLAELARRQLDMPTGRDRASHAIARAVANFTTLVGLSTMGVGVIAGAPFGWALGTALALPVDLVEGALERKKNPLAPLVTAHGSAMDGLRDWSHAFDTFGVPYRGDRAEQPRNKWLSAVAKSQGSSRARD